MGDPHRRPVGVRTYEGADNWEDYRTKFSRFARVVPRKGLFTLWGVISGADPRPEALGPDSSPEEFQERAIEVNDWEDQDAIGLHYISCTVHEKKRHVIRNAQSSYEVFE